MARKTRRPTARVTLSAVAQDAGVSISTASLILSQHPAYLGNFHPRTVEKVRRSAQRLGYRANLFASVLPTKGSVFFALVLHGATQAQTGRHQWAFEGDLLAGVVKVATASGVYPILIITGEEVEEASLPGMERVIAGGVFGSIVRSPCPMLSRLLRDQIDRGQPIAAVFPNEPSRWASNMIDVDNVDMGQQAGAALARRGARKWVLLSSETRESHLKRHEGFRRAAEKVGATVQVIRCPEEHDALTLSRRLLPTFKSGNIEGIFALTHTSSQAVQHVCAKVGIRLGETAYLIGCDCSMWNTPLVAPITSIEASWSEAGEIALKTLLELKRSNECRFDNIFLRARLVPGETCPLD